MNLYNFCEKCHDYHFGDPTNTVNDDIPPKVFCIICHKGLRRFFKLHWFENHRKELEK